MTGRKAEKRVPEKGAATRDTDSRCVLTLRVGDGEARPVNLNQRAGQEWLEPILGTGSEALQLYLLRQLATLGADGGEETLGEVLSRGAAVLGDIAPRTALEGLLAVQMIASHELAVEFAVRARRAETLPQLTAHANLSLKLARSFVAQIEALERLRGRKSEQTVTVRHITGENVVQGDFGPVAGGDLESLIEPEAQARASAGCGEGSGSC